MSIIIKEITVRTTIERTSVSTPDMDYKLSKLKREILKEMNEKLRKQRMKKGNR